MFFPRTPVCKRCPSASRIVRRRDAVLPFMPWLRRARLLAGALGKLAAQSELICPGGVTCVISHDVCLVSLEHRANVGPEAGSRPLGS